jgi:hypothetical protein
MTDTTSAHADSAVAAPAPPGQGGPGPKPAAGRGRRKKPDGASFDVAQFLVALLVLGVYVASMWLMFQHRADPQWDRMVYLFTGFEAIVYVAAGVIFGTRIQRASVEAAHEQSRQAREDMRAQRERGDRAAQLDEATATFIKVLKAYENEEPMSTGNGEASGAADRIGQRGHDAGTEPADARGGLSFAIKLAEELFPQGRG